MGYVGSVTAAAFSQRGHDVIGVDVNEQKVGAINCGSSPVLEPGLQEAIQQGTRSGRLKATTNAEMAVKKTEISLVCVGTPARKNGSFDCQHLVNAVRQIGAGIKSKDEMHVIAIRSTVLPGTIETLIAPELEKSSGKKAGRDFAVCANPEFMREGSSLRDFDNPPFVIIGTLADGGRQALEQLYQGIEPIISTSIKTAEVLKYVCNAFHAMKIAFANEIGNVCQALEIDSHEVMDLFCRDTKLNISPAYLKPGFAFGGSCLPKDLRALMYQAKNLDVQLPLLSAVTESNRLQLQRAVDLVMDTGKKKIGILGIAFKAGSDDLRESPLVSLCEVLIGKGLDLMIYDPNLVLDKLVGTNKSYIEDQIPHVGKLLCSSFEDLIVRSEVVVLGNRYNGLKEKLAQLNGNTAIIDLARLFDADSAPPLYQGICW
jgi:GDP-mannose 6-dehydrogenase